MIAAVPEMGLVVALDGDRAVRTDLGRDTVPFRLVVDGDDAYVTLRGTGEVAKVSYGQGEIAWRRPACRAPRGIAQIDAHELLVACAGGELVSVGTDGEVLDTHLLSYSDLRDVVVTEEAIYVSRFRSAQVLVLDPDTFEVKAVAQSEVAKVAWRMRLDPDRAEAVLLFQNNEVPRSPTDYYVADISGAETLSDGTFARINALGRWSMGQRVQGLTLPVDFILDNGSATAVNGSANRNSRGLGLHFAIDTERDAAEEARQGRAHGQGQPSAVALWDGNLVVQHAGAPGVYDHLGRTLWAPEVEGDLDAFDLFHQDPNAGVSCASCHPEGQDDGRTWTFGGRTKRTLSLSGGLLGRAPFHWNADLQTPSELMDETFTNGMAAGAVSEGRAENLFSYLDALPAVHATPAEHDDLELGARALRGGGVRGLPQRPPAHRQHAARRPTPTTRRSRPRPWWGWGYASP